MTPINTAIQWFGDHQAQGITYSMDYRNGPSSYDCSSSVYHALIAAGLLPSMRIGNTDSLFGDLERNGWTQIAPNAQGNFDTQRGDVFIWGKRGASSGGFGHTGIFTSAVDVIHCSGGYNGIHVDNYDQLRSWNDYPEQTFYRYVGSTAPAMAADPNDQNVDVGSFIKFEQTYTVDDVQLIDGTWQVRSNVLCPSGFTWADNGIPTQPLVEVDDAGYATADQDLNVGSKFKIPGKYQVLDLGFTDGAWLALIEASGMKFWLDIATATEVSSTDGGTPTPGQAPAQTTAIPVSTDATDSAAQPEPATVPVPKEPITQTSIDKPKENSMSFTQEQQQPLDKVNPIAPAVVKTPTEATKSASQFVVRIGTQIAAARIIAEGIFAIVQQQLAITVSEFWVGLTTLILAGILIFWAQFGYQLARNENWKWAANLKWPF